MNVSPVSVQRRSDASVTRRALLAALPALLPLSAFTNVPPLPVKRPTMPKPQTPADYGKEMRDHLRLTRRHTPTQRAAALVREFGDEFEVRYEANRAMQCTSMIGKTIFVPAEYTADQRARGIAWAIGASLLSQEAPKQRPDESGQLHVGRFAAWMDETARVGGGFAAGFLAA